MRRLLIVDDDTDLRDTLVEQLSLHDEFEASAVDTGAKGASAAKANAPDLVLMDVGLPDTDGREVVRSLRKGGFKAPIIMLTGHDTDSDTILGLESGANDYVAKPFRFAELVARVRSLLRLKNVYDELDDADRVIFALAAAVEAKDNYSEDHTERVALTSRALGLRLGLSEPQLDTLYRGGMIHDIGKLGIPDAILQKKGPLNQEEIVLMQTHPLVGEQIVAPLRSADSLREIVRNHHEHYDGEGYPDHLKGDDIPILARIVAVADAFDALVSDRPYRPGRTSDEAVAVLRDGSGSQWDPQVVALFATELVDFHTRLRAAG